ERLSALATITKPADGRCHFQRGTRSPGQLHPKRFHISTSKRMTAPMASTMHWPRFPGQCSNAPQAQTTPHGAVHLETTNLTNIAEKIDELAEGINNFKSEFGTRVSELERRAAREPVGGDYISHNDNNPLAAALR